jgi:aldose 1-epimerase
VEGGDFDFRSGRSLAGLEVDHSFTDLVWDAERRASAVLEDPSGSGVVMSWSQTCPWVQVYTDDQPTPESNRLGLAVEPMTCPPNAFNSHQDLIWLEPGQSHEAAWEIHAL